ncbi:MAG: sugar ABC transporter permease [Oscillospiraceae bacterium]|nr:sugar ABC transporter permease [Oscillospiraceae bacterium]
MKIICALCSAVIWGGGQVINKQRLKGLVFFLIQGVLVFVELSTGTLDVLTGKVEATFRNCGYFTKGLWGLVTLGEIPRASSSTLVYDHSVMLMITGIISTVILLFFVLIWIWNIKDAYLTRTQIEQGKKVSSVDYVKNLWNKSFEYIMITPGAILVLFISVIPVMFSMLVAFTNYNHNAIPPRYIVDWVGFKSFTDLVMIPIWGSTFVKVLIWTVSWAFIATFTAYGFGLLQAVLINAEGIRFKKAWRSILILPWAMPALVSLLVFRVLFKNTGAFNNMLLRAGIINDAIPFLSSTGWARTSIVLVNMWLSFPFFMALISAAMTSISPELHEAVEIDGGNGWHKFRYISLPTILTVTAPMIVMSVANNFNNFGAVYFLTGGKPLDPGLQMAGTTDILITWIFKLTLDYRMYNIAAAVSILIFILIATVSGINMMRTRSFKED